MIKLESINRVYRSDIVETTALNDIDLNIDVGEFVSIMGPSGCGKSTLLNILGSIDRPSSGQFLFENVDLTSQNEASLARHRRDRLGFIFQSFNLIDDLTIAENVELGLLYRKEQTGNRKEQIQAAMDRVAIGHRAQHYPHQLSGGQQQRAAIARAIVGEPKLLLADEPTGNLDTENGLQVMEILAGLNQEGSTIVMVTHSPAHADYATRQIGMVDGRISHSSHREN